MSITLPHPLFLFFLLFLLLMEMSVLLNLIIFCFDFFKKEKDHKKVKNIDLWKRELIGACFLLLRFFFLPLFSHFSRETRLQQMLEGETFTQAYSVQQPTPWE